MTILLVDDNPADIRLTIEALKDGDLPSRLEVARDGDEAVATLRNAIAGVGVPVPDLILLDLNLPRKDGREVLAEIKADLDLRRIPVVVLTTSNAEDDIAGCYDLHANCYITKPIDFDRYVDVVKSIEAFWHSTVRLPNRR
jgi:CheY-like chemotaxis protein